MRAKTINEIKKGGDGFGSIGVGHTALLRGYNYIQQNWPHVIRDKFMFDDTDRTYIQKIIATHELEGLSFEELGLDRLENGMDCSITDIAILRIHKAPTAMCTWIMENCLRKMSNDNSVVRHDDVRTAVSMRYSSFWGVGKITYYTHNKEKSISTSSAYYVIRYK